MPVFEETGWRYGADGYPYVLGLGTVAAAAAGTGLGMLRREGRDRRPAWVCLSVGAVAAVPAVLGLRYITTGKIALRDRMLSQVDWRGGEDVADLGAGRGLLSIGAARRTRGTVHCVDLFIAKDLSGNTPERLLGNARRAGVESRLEIRREDVRAVGLADGGVDVVLSALCLHNLAEPADRAAAISEAVRIVKPGGTVVISDLAHVDDEYAVALEQAGFTVRRAGRVPNTFPPQRMLVAVAPA